MKITKDSFVSGENGETKMEATSETTRTAAGLFVIIAVRLDDDEVLKFKIKQTAAATVKIGLPPAYSARRSIKHNSKISMSMELTLFGHGLSSKDNGISSLPN